MMFNVMPFPDYAEVLERPVSAWESIAPSASMAVRPRRASSAAMAVFPAPEQPVIWTALIGSYRRLTVMPGANEFAGPLRRRPSDHRPPPPAGPDRPPARSTVTSYAP